MIVMVVYPPSSGLYKKPGPRIPAYAGPWTEGTSLARRIDTARGPAEYPARPGCSIRDAFGELISGSCACGLTAARIPIVAYRNWRGSRLARAKRLFKRFKQVAETVRK
jgi:hypothetical protein